jgi:alpha-ketoglutarate-dependent taurine dioxygenase
MTLAPLSPAHPSGLPLLVSPAGDARADTLADAIRAEHARVEDALTEAGAVLFRGWDVPDAHAFERIARAVDPELKNEYLGTSPRNGLTSHVFTASELPPFFPIPQHNEMSFTKAPPRRLFFACLTPSVGPGGETPLCDMRKVWRALDPAVRERFAARGVTNVRNYAGPEGGAWWDPWKLKRWDEMFGTTDKDAVTRRAEQEGFTPEWDGERLRLVNTQPAMKPHPRTGEPVWFNHSQVFHLDAVPAEYGRIAGRLGARWHAWGALARGLLGLKRLAQRDDEQAMHCTYGDGSPIPAADMEAVREAIWANLVAIPWQRGDVLAIDNDAVSHGRMPYRGERLVVVAWA